MRKTWSPYLWTFLAWWGTGGWERGVGGPAITRMDSSVQGLRGRGPLEVPFTLTVPRGQHCPFPENAR